MFLTFFLSFFSLRLNNSLHLCFLLYIDSLRLTFTYLLTYLSNSSVLKRKFIRVGVLFVKIFFHFFSFQCCHFDLFLSYVPFLQMVFNVIPSPSESTPSTSLYYPSVIDYFDYSSLLHSYQMSVPSLLFFSLLIIIYSTFNFLKSKMFGHVIYILHASFFSYHFV